MRLAVLALLLGLLPATAAAGLVKDPAPGVVVQVVDGDTVVLDDRREVRMVGIQAPKLPLGRRDFPTWPLADVAKDTLSSLLAGKTVMLSYGGRRTDRHGRELAHVHRRDGLWAQGEMLRLGMARVYSFYDNTAMVDEMLALERTARAARHGIWAHPYYYVVNAADAGRFIGEFKLVEGRLTGAALVKGRAYLNFGPDWRTDFTIAIGRRAVRRFDAAADEKVDWPSWAGRPVRVRGWLKSYNGAMIEVTHPAQIELLER